MEIQEIKTHLRINQVLSHYSLKPTRNNMICCPFHADKTPSMQIYPETNTVYCFSSNCKTHGKALDVIDFIMHQENQSKHEAILKAQFMLSGAEVSMLPKTPTPKREPTRITLLTQLFTYFQNAVHRSSPAKDYLETRCLDHQTTEVGYNSGQFHHGQRKEEGLINSCLKYGLLLDRGLKSKTGEPAYKCFGKNGIVFPLKNQQGQIVSFYFRSTQDKGTHKHFYLKDRQGLYPGYPEPTTKKLILTESIIDAASLLEQPAIKNNYTVLALYGTNGLGKEHSQAIADLTDLEEIIFFLDGDDSGRKAIEKYAPLLQTQHPQTCAEQGRSIKITQIPTPENEDINSLLQGHTPQLLTDLIKSRQPTTLIFSNEKPPEKEKSTTLNTQNPHNLQYPGRAATYQIKGFRTHQLDSLKITLQITNR